MKLVCQSFVYLTSNLFVLSLVQVVKSTPFVPKSIVAERFIQDVTVTGDPKCISSSHLFDENVHKHSYRVAVQAINGLDDANERYHLLFSEYLSKTAGRRFDPPIDFQAVALQYIDLFDQIEQHNVDFIYSDPGVYSCVGIEFGAQPLVTTVAHLKVRGYDYNLDVYAGVIFTMASNDDIEGMEDLADKIIGAGDISMLMGAQVQFHGMEEEAGLSYVTDPKQVVFTKNQAEVVDGVLNGDFDVGFVRTSMIELYQDKNGKFIDPDTFKIIAPKVHDLDNGKLFPFLHSTEIYPEFPVAALPHVYEDVSTEVQAALLALEAHALAQEEYMSKGIWNPDRCDTSMEIAKIAYQVRKESYINSFRPPRSYFKVNPLQEEIDFVLQDERGVWKCDRDDNIYDKIHCPIGYYKLPLDEFEQTCAKAGLECKAGQECYCKPCIRAHQVDVFECWHDDDYIHADRHIGCGKMSVCSTLMQTKPKTIRIRDNLERDNPEVTVIVHQGPDTFEVPVIHVDTNRYKISLQSSYVGVAVMEVLFDGEQIPESPFRVQINDLDCDIDYPGQRKTSTGSGQCVCASNTIDLFGKCIESWVVAVSISAVAIVLVTLAGSAYVRHRTHKNDQMWLVNIDELQFSDPVEVIGQGSFGVVLLADYRGTKVALKRAIKTTGKMRSTRGKSTWRGSRGSHGGSRGHSGSGTSGDPYASSGMASSDDEGSDDERDVEAAEGESDATGSSAGEVAASTGRVSGGGSGSNPLSIGFLAKDFGGRQSTWKKYLPWSKASDFHQQRFKEAIFGLSSAGSTSMTKSWHARFCPWFSSQVQKEEEFMSEMRVLARLRHPCITTVMGAVISRSHDPMLVMEYMEYGSLYDLLSNETMMLSGEIILQIMRDLAQGLRFLHTSKPSILHGDLKGRNILIDSRFRAKLCDFGLSSKKDNRITGTPYWLAPEYLRGQTNYSTECDIYSVSIVIYEVYARQDPYKGENFRDTLRKICDRRTNKRPEIPEACPSRMIDLMKKCWSPDPHFRPVARDLDTTLLDMSTSDAEPVQYDDKSKNTRKERPTGDMLYELFPKHVADQLKAGLKVEPEQHENVTIIFSDVVHFDEISRKLPAIKISNMLDRLYLAFDKIAKANKVFKVETIGDCYMGVCNLEKDQEATHVKHAAEFAVELIDEAGKILIDEEKPELGCLNVRVGFHSGPVVSNVIGSLNPRYCLFGDTVNTAARMGTNSRSNRILCAQSTFELLADQAPNISAKIRGKIFVKGKGDMFVYWVGDKEILAKVDPPSVLPPTVQSMDQDAKQVGFMEDDSDHDISAEMWQRNPGTPVSNTKSGHKKAPKAPAIKKLSKSQSPPEAPKKGTQKGSKQANTKMSTQKH